MKENIVKDKSFAFALRVIKLAKFLESEKRQFVLSRQLLRSGTAVGAWYARQSTRKAKRILFTR